MKKIICLLMLLSFGQVCVAQSAPAHTHDLLAVKFSPDDSQLLSYSWGDSWLILWETKSGSLIWKTKTSLIQRANERYNLHEFYWSEDNQLIITKSENGTYQSWDAQTGRLAGVFDKPPDVKLKSETENRIVVRKISDYFYLVDTATRASFKVPIFSRTGSTYDVSHNNELFAEGGSWGNAAIKITEFRSGKSWLLDGHLSRQPATPTEPSELEIKLANEKKARRAVIQQQRAKRNQQAAIDVANFKKLVHITFDHYGDMDDPGEKRMLESNEPKKSLARKSAGDATAVWLRLHNDSPLPIKIPTQSMYLPDPKCFFDFANGERMLGLCDNREVSIWHGLEDKSGKSVQYGFDFGATSILLPKTTAVFPIPLVLLQDGKAINFAVTFLKDGIEAKIENYGDDIVL
ncbi:MAG TPA: WD40 repeat domain-containing protein, partial [Anaerolineales bacterium]|nr:WD40 repeat domain-containing protein [Anaerolineales bacterium]